MQCSRMSSTGQPEYEADGRGRGRQLLIDVKRCGDNVDHPDRVHVLLIHETAMSVTESGVMVSM